MYIQYWYFTLGAVITVRSNLFSQFKLCPTSESESGIGSLTSHNADQPHKPGGPWSAELRHQQAAWGHSMLRWFTASIPHCFSFLETDEKLHLSASNCKLAAVGAPELITPSQFSVSAPTEGRQCDCNDCQHATVAALTDWLTAVNVFCSKPLPLNLKANCYFCINQKEVYLITSLDSCLSFKLLPPVRLFGFIASVAIAANIDIYFV